MFKYIFLKEHDDSNMFMERQRTFNQMVQKMISYMMSKGNTTFINTFNSKD